MNRETVVEFQERIGSFLWNNGLDNFCKLLGKIPKDPWAQEKYQKLLDIGNALAGFDSVTLLKILNWKEQPQ